MQNTIGTKTVGAARHIFNCPSLWNIEHDSLRSYGKSCHVVLCSGVISFNVCEGQGLIVFCAVSSSLVKRIERKEGDTFGSLEMCLGLSSRVCLSCARVGPFYGRWAF